MATSKSRKPRAYHSPKRARQAEQTRKEIVATAVRLFAERGYAATSVARIAREAGVSPQTIYASVGSKGDILLAVSLGDILGIRPMVDEVMKATDPREVVRLTMKVRRHICEHGSDFMRAVRSAAASDPAAAAGAEAGSAHETRAATKLVELLVDLRALKPELSNEDAIAIYTTVTSWCAYDMLVGEHGWSPDRVEAWWTETISALLLR